MYCMTQSHSERTVKPRVGTVTTARDARLANLIGVVATGLNDQTSMAMVDAARLDGAAPAALVALLDFTPGGSVDTLSRVVGLTHSGTVRLVARLVEAGLVERTTGDDARTVLVTLTRRGRALARKVRDRRGAEVTASLAGLSDAERDRLLRSCELLVANLTRRRLDQRAAGARPPGGALCRMCDFGACRRRQGGCPAAQTVAQATTTGRAGDR